MRFYQVYEKSKYLVTDFLSELIYICYNVLHPESGMIS